MAPFSKFIEDFFRFECPPCHELRATVNPKNNLAHCFCCQYNINNIDLMIEIGYDFKLAVSIFKDWLDQYKKSVYRFTVHSFGVNKKLTLNGER